MMRCRQSSPSVSATGPGCRMNGDLISCNTPLRTTGTSTRPIRAATYCGWSFSSHELPMNKIGWSTVIFAPMRLPDAARDALNVALGVDGDPLSDGEPDRPGTSEGLSGGQP